MRILIISLPRCGSTSLLYKIAKEENLRPLFEPFDGSGRQLYGDDMDDIVVKTILRHRTDNEEFTKKFDKVILLSRKNLKEHTESYGYFWYEQTNGNYKSTQHYTYVSPPQWVLENSEKLLIKWNSELEEISKNTNIPITYYEDIYDTNSIDRLRIPSTKDKLI